MKISVFYNHILDAAEQRGLTIAQVLQRCRACGISGVEILIDHLREDGGEILRMLRDAGLEISCIFGFYDFGNSTDFSKAKEHIDTAHELNVKKILLVPGFLGSTDAEELNRRHDSWQETADYMAGNSQIAQMKEMLIQCVDYASTYGIQVTLEDFDGKEAPFARIYQLLWFMQQVPGLKYTLDMGNFAYSDEDVTAAYEQLRQYIVHVHCKDRGVEPKAEGRFCKGLLPAPAGSGYLPIGELLERLKASGYDDWLAIEHYFAPDQMAFMEESARYLKEAWR